VQRSSSPSSPWCTDRRPVKPDTSTQGEVDTSADPAVPATGMRTCRALPGPRRGTERCGATLGDMLGTGVERSPNHETPTPGEDRMDPNSPGQPGDQTPPPASPYGTPPASPYGAPPRLPTAHRQLRPTAPRPRLPTAHRQLRPTAPRPRLPTAHRQLRPTAPRQRDGARPYRRPDGVRCLASSVLSSSLSLSSWPAPSSLR